MSFLNDVLSPVESLSSRDVTILVVGIVVVLSLPGVWRTLRHVVTIVHEGGHAFIALAAGRQLSGIRLHSDTSGLTVSRGRPRGFGMIMTAAAGYTAPLLLVSLVLGLFLWDTHSLGCGVLLLSLWSCS